MLTPCLVIYNISPQILYIAIIRKLRHCFFVESLQLLNRSRRAGSQRPAAVPPFREWRQEVETKKQVFPPLLSFPNFLYDNAICLGQPAIYHTIPPILMSLVTCSTILAQACPSFRSKLGHFWSQNIHFSIYPEFGSSDFHETLRKCSWY